jgi:hypothetical protein
MSGMYVVSVRDIEDRAAVRAAAYAHVGLAVDGVSQEQAVLAAPFRDSRFTTVDLMTYIDNLHALATDPSVLGLEAFDPFGERGGSDSESRPVTMFMFATGGKTDQPDWLACAEVAHETWPRLLDTLGVSVGGTVFDDDGEYHVLSLDRFITPKALRLKSGWDYDAEGNQMWLPIEEAWRRFVAHNDARTERDGEEYMNAKTLRRMRKHLESFYGGFATTREKQEHDKKANAPA